MPHVIIKLQSGRSAAQKTRIANEVTRALVVSAECTEDAVSVGIEDVEQKDWGETVYRPDILGKTNTIYKQPGYDPGL